MTSTGSDQRAYQMTMNKGDPSYQMSPRRMLFAERGTEVRISPLLEGIRTTERGEDPVVFSFGAARSYSQLRSAHQRHG